MAIFNSYVSLPEGRRHSAWEDGSRYDLMICGSPALVQGNLAPPRSSKVCHLASLPRDLCRAMSVQKTYMGRIFMKPLVQSRGQNAELYINIGASFLDWLCDFFFCIFWGGTVV
jgi:hypothetical protein